MKRFSAPILCLCLVAVSIYATLSILPVQAEGNVIYGTNTGIPVDATISKVTFDRSGDDLVTTFEVKGRISTVYSYQIAIVLSPPTSANFAYKVLTYSGGYTEPSFFNYGTGKTETIRYKIEGKTWTAWTPLSYLNYQVHFWVWIGTLSGSYNWIDTGNQLENTFFEVKLPARLTVRVQPASLSSQVRLKVDGKDSAFSAGDELSTMIVSGIMHRVDVTQAIPTSEDARYVVQGWSDTRSAKESRSLMLDADTIITVTYGRQFVLKVRSEYGTAMGEGWYDEGTTASFSVWPPEIAYNGFLGTVGLKHLFTGWTGAASTSSTQGSLTMDGPKTVMARWTTTYAPRFIGFLVMIIGVIALIVAVPILFSRRKRASTSVQKTPSSTKLCKSCGKLLPIDAEYCNECGTKQE
jgi:ribosomal protein L40E